MRPVSVDTACLTRLDIAISEHIYVYSGICGMDYPCMKQHIA